MEKKKEKKRKEPEKVGSDIYGVKSNWKMEDKMEKNSGSDVHHSGYFHRYFRGYTEIRTEKANGGYKIERFYTEPWMVQDVQPAMYVWYRIMYVMLVLISVIGFLVMMTTGGYDGNRSVLVAVPEFAAVIALVLWVAAAVNYAFTRKQMTLYDYNSTSGNLKKASLAAAITVGLTALAVVINIFLGVDSILKELRLAGAVLLCAVPPLIVYLMERHMPYREEENKTVLPPGEAHEIW